METLRFTIPGEPAGQPRPRARAVPIGRGKYSARVFQPARERGTDGVMRDLPITVWRRHVARVVARNLPPESWTGPVRLEVVFWFERTQEYQRRKHSPGEIPHTVRPDVDNLIKAVMDELVEQREGQVITRRGILHDDNCVCELSVRKAWAERGAGPGAHVTLTRLAEPEPVLWFRERRKTHIGGFKLAEPKPDGWTAAEQMAADMRGEIEG